MSHSGRVADGDGETWSGINTALQAGRRGFPGGSSLARVLAKHRGVRNPKDPPRPDGKTNPHLGQAIPAAPWVSGRPATPGRSTACLAKPGPWSIVRCATGNAACAGGASLFKLLRKHFNISKRQVQAAEGR